MHKTTKLLLRSFAFLAFIGGGIITYSVSTTHAAPGPTCPALAVGDEIKVNEISKTAIYVLDRNLKPRYFYSGYEYKTYKNDYTNFKLIDQQCLDSLGVPGGYPSAINYRPGFGVVRGPDNKLYVLEPGNAVRVISANMAKQIYGPNYKVTTIAPREWGQYICKKTPEITEVQSYHSGMTIKTVSQPNKVYYVDAQKKLREVASQAMAANFILPQYVYTVADAAVQGASQGELITGPIPELTDRTQSSIGCDGGTTPPPPQNGDTTLPTVTISSPTLNQTLKDTVTVLAEARDNVGVTRVDLLINGETKGNFINNGGATWQTSWDTKTTANSDKVNLQAKAYDAAGNSNLSPTMMVKVDNMVIPPPPQATAGVLSVVYDPNENIKADNYITVGDAKPDQTLAVFKLSATNEDFNLTFLKVGNDGTYTLPNSSITDLRLFKDNDTTALALDRECSPTGCDFGKGGASFLTIPRNGSVILKVKGNIPAKNTTKLGEKIHPYLNLGSFITGGSGQISGALNSASNLSFKAEIGDFPYNIFLYPGPTPLVLGVAPDEGTPVTALKTTYGKGDRVVGTFRISNTGVFPITVSSVKFDDSGRKNSEYIYDLWHANSNQAADPNNWTLAASASPNLTFNSLQNNGIKIPVGGSVDLMIRINNFRAIGAEQAGDLFTLSLNPLNVRYKVSEANLGYDGNANGNQTDEINAFYASGVVKKLGTVIVPNP
jgi:hypothetical protein